MSRARTWLIGFRWGIFLLACAYIWSQLASAKGNQSVQALWALLKAPPMRVVISAVFILMLLNWWVEAIKWRLLLKPFVRIGHWRAFIATIAGTSVALISPNRTGEFVGRVMFLDPDRRIKGAVATMLGGIAQFIATLLAGAVALLFISRTHNWDGGFIGPMLGALAFLTIACAIVAIVFYSNTVLLSRVILAFPFLERWRSDVFVLDMYSRSILRNVLLLAFLRYTIFTSQFVLLLVTLDRGLAIGDALLGVPLIFLVSTLIPTVLLTELGVRGSVALAVLVPVGAVESHLLLATFTIWAINLMLPAVAGSLILLAARIRTRSAK